MAYADNYPNGFKDGYSSSDDPDRRDFSPSGAKERQINAMIEDYNRRAAEERYQAGVDRMKSYRDKLRAEKEREEFRIAEMEREAKEEAAQRRKAVNILVQQKRDEYNQKSWFGKAISSLRGESFDKLKKQIIETAERRVNIMSPERIEKLIEKNEQKGGKQR